MKFQLNNLNFQAEIGYVMTFDVYFPQVGVKIFRLRLVRPDAAPDQTWLHFHKASDGGHAVSIGPITKQEIGEEATRVYNQFRGTNWTFALKPMEREALAERADDGLRRVLCASVEDGLRQVAA